ncbi:hypothetical protein EC973_004778 [Apophysomyces ossiformis]|uniref:Uncharacterized protein n=1 Tax=Apophysomyces ossiformis TaxID=679940 RepID=A0A8H7BUW2_9FUNG|nr:hypothetical protein EC973_004778 [Apophysomyces ossiformis]
MTQHEFARNFYDDMEFCPLQGEEVLEHRERIQQRTSPQPSPSYSRRAIPIIDPTNMTPVPVPVRYPLSPPWMSVFRSTGISVVDPSTGQVLRPMYEVPVQ